MATLSIELDDNVLKETEEVLSETDQTHNAYINEAVAFYNRVRKRSKLARQLAKESALVRESSMEVLAEFEALEGDYDY